MDRTPPFVPDAARPSSLGLALHEIEADVRRACDRLLDESGLTYPELLLLEALWNADGATPDALAYRTCAPLGVVNLQLDRLAELDLVEPTADGVWLTADGFALRRDAEGVSTSPAADRARFALQSLRVGLSD